MGLGETKKIAVLFPGQGSQYIGMGKAFAEQSPAARELFEKAETITGIAIQRLCFEGPFTELTKTVNLQPALTAVNLACWQAMEQAGVTPSFFAGHSLGEYSALYAAKVLTYEDTLTVVTERGRLMQREAERFPGGMRAVLGLTIEEVQETLEGLIDAGIVVVANHNAENQVVISGELPALDKATEVLSVRKGKVIPLGVSSAMHSPLVKDAVPDFISMLDKIRVSPPKVPIVFNVTAAVEHGPESIRRIMASQIASAVKWVDIIRFLQAQGVQTFIEVGPKRVLTGLLRKILPKGYEHQGLQVEDPETLTKCLVAMG